MNEEQSPSPEGQILPQLKSVGEMFDYVLRRLKCIEEAVRRHGIEVEGKTE